jgi:arginase
VSRLRAKCPDCKTYTAVALGPDYECPLVLGGCCCAHVGAVEGLAARNKRLALVWFDAHGDLNTPETSPSGNTWGMPLRMLVDSGAVDDDAVALVGARRLDPAEEDFISRSALHVGADEIGDALEGAEGVYVAFDCDSLDAGEVAPFMPEPGGLTVAQAERLLETVRGRAEVLGVGFSGLVAAPQNVAPLTRLCAALGL